MATKIPNVPKCLYCTNDMVEGHVAAFCLMLFTSECEGGEVVCSGYICGPCLEKQDKSVRGLFDPDVPGVRNLLKKKG